MLPLFVLISAFIVFFLAGQFGLAWFYPWMHVLRASLTCMLLLTASGHWGRRRADLIAMVPPPLPSPGLIITLTGIVEIAGAIGLLFERTHRAAALSLVVFFIAIFPANVRAATQHLTIKGRPVLGVVPRGAIQIIFIAVALLCAL